MKLSFFSHNNTNAHSSSESLFDRAQHKTHLRYGKRVRALRKILPLTAGGIFLLILTWPEITTSIEALKESSIVSRSTLYIRNRLSAPKIYSTDEKGHPYTLSAKSALQKDKDTADLDAPVSKIILEDGTTLEIKADLGIYNNMTKNLDYQQNVLLLNDKGYTLRTSVAHINLQTKKAFGEAPIEGESPTGTIKAEGFHATSKGDIFFEGKSQLTILPKESKVSKGQK